ncbi:MAG: peptide ABC transporter substrate-binding protein [Thermoplasmata archaeon M9B2D]|nr:MAG: peptide ABC transporter substrate-binding protein [Thermoplasmata archaeon M9B2D]
MSTAGNILEVHDLQKWFPVRSGVFSFFRKGRYVKAVDKVSFSIAPGDSLCIVGESGCGKTTLARTILRLIEPTGGSIFYKGEDVLTKNREEMRQLRLKMQLIFQNPYEVLDPRLQIRTLVGEALSIHNLVEDEDELEKRVLKVLEDVRLIPSDDFAGRYTHELSGGQLQRVCIARSLILKPDLVIADEPVSMLDASIRTEIMNLMEDLKREYGLTYIFITHDLAQARYIGNQIIVMYLGRIAEMGPMEDVIQNPVHPYTRALVSNVPIPSPDEERQRIMLPGETPTPVDLPPGCRFKPRCQEIGLECGDEEPELREVSPGHFVSCWR